MRRNITHIFIVALVPFGVLTANVQSVAAQVSGDDTFSCYDEFKGPLFKRVTGDQGYVNWRIATGDDTYPDESRIDARGATWRQEHLGRNMGTKPAFPWVVTIGNGWQGKAKPSMCWIGGRFIGSTPMSFGYREIKSNAGEAINFGSDGGVIDGLRIHNIHEDGIGISMGKGSNIGNDPVIIKNTWISYNLANAIEDDHVPNTVIDDILIDGSYGPISIDPGSKYSGECKEKNNTISILNSLVRGMKTFDSGGQSADYSIWIKTHGVSETCRVFPKIVIENTIFAFDGWADNHDAESGRLTKAWEHIVSCKNNVIAWTSEKPFPGSHTFPDPPSCFKIVKGKAARDLWAAAKQNWINCHPKVEHVPGDPSANPSQCNPNAYGGGQGANTPSGGGSGGATPNGCNLYGSGATAPQGYAPAWSVFSSTKSLHLDSDCKSNGSVEYTVGVPGYAYSSLYIYKGGYYYANGAWNSITFTGPSVAGSSDWLLGEGHYAHQSAPQSTYFWVGYECNWTGGAWKCGCRDSACTTNYWQLQGVVR